jgi:hypothetical protein
MANPSVKGTANVSATTTVTIPTHAIGDLIVIWAYRDGSTTAPTKPSASGTVPAWTDIDTGTGTATNGGRTAYFVATATNHTSGTWTNSTGMIAVVIQNQKSSSFLGGHARAGGTASNSSTAPAITQQQTTGKALLLYFYGHRTVTAWSTAPTGFTRQISNATEVCLNTKDSSTSDGSQAQANTASSSGYYAATVEILGAETSPTTALNTPADAATGQTTTPTLNFTGTDAESDAVEYQLQVAAATFADITLGNTLAGGSTSIASDSFAFDSGTGTNRILIMGFSTFDTTTGNRPLTAVTYAGVPLTKITNAVSDNATSNGRSEMWYLVNPATGSNTAAFTFTGTVAGSDRFAVIFNNVDQSNPIDDSDNGTTVAGTQQRITLTTTYIGEVLVDVNNGNAGPMTIGVSQTSLMDRSGSTGRGSYQLVTKTGNYNMDMNRAANDDFAHAAISLKPAVTIVSDALSSADAGYTAGHPFASGAAKDYTVQSALSNSTTYYWRVRAIDPTGSNAWGAWATVRSFTTASGGGGSPVYHRLALLGVG